MGVKNEMEFKQYLSAMWKWRWLIALAVFIAGGVSYWNVSKMPPTYEATISVRVGQFLESTDPQARDLTTSQQLANVYAMSVRRQPILQATVDSLGLETTWDALAKKVNASVVQGTSMVQINAADSNPETAKILVDELARQLILQSPSSQEKEIEQQRQFVSQQLATLQQRIEAAQKQIEQIDNQIAAESSARSIRDLEDQSNALQAKVTNWHRVYADLLDFYKGGRVNYLSVADPSSVPSTPVGPSKWLYVFLAMTVALLLAAAGGLAIEYFDDSLHSESEVGPALGLTAIGSVVRLSKLRWPADSLVSQRDSRSPASESFRTLRTNVQFLAAGDDPITVMVTSPSAGEGKSFISSNLAISFAQSGRQTILVDADLRYPRLHTAFGAPNDRGLSQLFVSEPGRASGNMELAPRNLRIETRYADVRDRLREHLLPTDTSNLWLLPGGPVPLNPAELIGSARMEQIIKAIAELADVIVFDSAPLLPVTDSVVLAGKGPAVVLVAEAGKTRTLALRRAKDMLSRANARILGLVLNGVSKGDLYATYRYYGRYGEPEMGSAASRERSNGTRTRVAAAADSDPGSPGSQAAA